MTTLLQLKQENEEQAFEVQGAKQLLWKWHLVSCSGLSFHRLDCWVWAPSNMSASYAANLLETQRRICFLRCPSHAMKSSIWLPSITCPRAPSSFKARDTRKDPGSMPCPTWFKHDSDTPCKYKTQTSWSTRVSKRFLESTESSMQVYANINYHKLEIWNGTVRVATIAFWLLSLGALPNPRSKGRVRDLLSFQTGLVLWGRRTLICMAAKFESTTRCKKAGSGFSK